MKKTVVLVWFSFLHMQFGSVWLIGEKKKKLIWCGYGVVLRPLAGWPFGMRSRGASRTPRHTYGVGGGARSWYACVRTDLPQRSSLPSCCQQSLTPSLSSACQCLFMYCCRRIFFLRRDMDSLKCEITSPNYMQPWEEKKITTMYQKDLSVKKLFFQLHLPSSR